MDMVMVDTVMDTVDTDSVCYRKRVENKKWVTFSANQTGYGGLGYGGYGHGYGHGNTEMILWFKTVHKLKSYDLLGYGGHYGHGYGHSVRSMDM